jgi:hypothetical protein
MAHRNQSGAGARILRRSVGTASLLKEAARVLLDGLAADRPTLYRTKGPCSFRNPPSTALSRGPRCLHHARSPGVLILERSDRVPYIRLPHGGPRVRIHLPPAESRTNSEARPTACHHQGPRSRILKQGPSAAHRMVPTDFEAVPLIQLHIGRSAGFNIGRDAIRVALEHRSASLAGLRLGQCWVLCAPNFCSTRSASAPLAITFARNGLGAARE